MRCRLIVKDPLTVSNRMSHLLNRRLGAANRALVALNPWYEAFAGTPSGRSVTAINAARREAALQRVSQGAAVWNQWAEAMQRLALNAAPGAEASLVADAAVTDFAGTRFNGNAQFHGFVFPAACSFRDCRFEREAWFTASHFCGDADFSGAGFSRAGASFEQCRFDGDAKFSDSCWDGAAEWRSAVIRRGAHFERCGFGRDVWFAGTHFSGTSHFAEAEFQGDAGFGSCRFEGAADFRKAHFRDNAGFEDAHFAAETFFDEARFDRKVWLRRAQFEGPVSFDRARFVNFSALNRTDAHFAEDALPAPGTVDWLRSQALRAVT